MTDVLIVAGLALLLTPLAALSWWLFLPAVGGLLFVAGVVRSFGEDVLRRQGGKSS